MELTVTSNEQEVDPQGLDAVQVTVVVPDGNVAESVAVEPGQSVPMVLNSGEGVAATTMLKLPVLAHPFTVALKLTV